MPLNPNSLMTLGMVIPVKDLNLTQEQLALLNETDVPHIAERVFMVLIGNSDSFEEDVRFAIQTYIVEKTGQKPTN